MMQPTPAPTSPPGSPKPATQKISIKSWVDEPIQEPPINRGSAPFGVLVGLFEKLSNERKLDRRMRLLNSWFTHWRTEKGHDLFPVLRLILPQKDRERSVYGLKEKNIAKTYIALMGLARNDPDAIRLQNWKRPTERDKSSGDFPTVLYEVISKRSSVIEETISIQDVNDFLDELCDNHNKSSVQAKILQRLYNRATAEEQRWIARIILKDMQISVKETTVFAVFHPDAQDLYNTCSDLKRVAWTLCDPQFRLKPDEKAVRLFRAFAPMLCKRPTKTIEHSVKEMGGSEFYIEEKLDGERMQLHKRGNEYFYCSRKGKDYTYLYGKHVGAGSLTPHLAKALDERVEDIILDGEMLVWDPISKRNLPFGTLKTHAISNSKAQHNPRPCFKVFDLLYLNGQSLLDKSTAFRKRNMRACLTEIPGRVEFSIEFKGKTAKDIRERMEVVMADKGEGLVIKHPSSKYVLNGRTLDWIKVKPEYIDNMGETVDVLVVAGNYGTGARSGGVSTLICAVLDDRQGEADDEPKYSTFVRIGSGLTYADYVWIRAKPWKTWDPRNPPSFLKTSKKGPEDKGDVYLEPEDSFILKVKAAEVVVSTQYHIGHTMRFPRALSIRDDLTVADCMTATEVLESMKSEKKRTIDGDGEIRAKKKRKTNTAVKAEVLPDYKGPRLKDVPVESNIFEGLKFVVMADPKSQSGNEQKKELTMLIHQNGGSIAQIAKDKDEVYVVYGGAVIPYDLKLIINKGIHDVVKPEWIRESVHVGKMVKLKKRFFFHATATTKATDEYDGDEDENTGAAIPDETDSKDHLDIEFDAKDNSITRGVSGSAQGSGGPETETEAKVVAKIEEVDPAFLDWFDVGKPELKDESKKDDESVTEDDEDSDNADVAGSGSDAATIDDDDDDWERVGSGSKSHGADGGVVDADLGDPVDRKEPDNVKMGEDDNAMEYDQERIFRHLCFYLDSPGNARKYGMTAKSKHEKAIEASFVDLAKTITNNGGRVTDILEEGKLTHIVVDKRDDSRRIELMKRTANPKRRHVIITEYIRACLEEGTLLDEDEFQP